MTSILNVSQLASPLGLLSIAANEKGIVSITFEKEDAEVPQNGAPNQMALHWLQEAKAQLEAYFSGQRTTFELPLIPSGTPFQQKVWAALGNIPFGKSWSYLALANHIADHKAVRAVGSANGKNPIPIIIPCHRVIGSNGQLVGFSGGLWRKEWLLRHEEHPAFRAQQMTLF